jgi:hypothetical protein
VKPLPKKKDKKKVNKKKGAGPYAGLRWVERKKREEGERGGGVENICGAAFRLHD